MCSEKGSTQWFPSSQCSGAGQVSMGLFPISPTFQGGELPEQAYSSEGRPCSPRPFQPGLTDVTASEKSSSLHSGFLQATMGKKPCCSSYRVLRPSLGHC